MQPFPLDTRRFAALALAALVACASGCRRAEPPAPTPAAPPAPPPVAPAPPSAPPPPVAQAATGLLQVAFDQSLGQISSPFDPSFDGLASLAAALRRHGMRVSLNHRPLASFLADFNGSGRVLVLGIPWRIHYSADDLLAVERFLESGGGVLVIVEHDDIFANAEIQSALTARFGITPLADHAETREASSKNNRGRWPLCRVPDWQLDDVRMYWPAPLRVEPPATPLMLVEAPKDEGTRIVAAAHAGRAGRLVVLGDLEILWTMTPETGARGDGNPAFLLRLFGHLAGHDRSLAPQAIEPRLDPAWSVGTRTALFDASGLGLLPDGTFDGLDRLAAHLHARGYRIAVGEGDADVYAQADLVISVTPLEALPEARRVRSARRVLLVGDGRTDFVRAAASLLKPLGLHDAPQPADPINAVARSAGLELERVTLLDAEDRYRVTAQLEDGSSLLLHRSAAVRILSPDDTGHTAIAVAALGSVPTETLAPVQPRTEVSAIPRRPARSGHREVDARRRWPVVVASEQVMLVADLELVTDPFLSTDAAKPWLRALDAWLAEKATPLSPAPDAE